LVVLVGSASVWADTVKGKVKRVDADKSTITVTADDKNQSFDVAKDAKVVKVVGKGKKATTETVQDGLKGVAKDQEVTLTTETKDDKDVVTQVKIERARNKANGRGGPGPEVGQPAPELKLKTLEGKEVDLASSKDKMPVVLIFGSCT